MVQLASTEKVPELRQEAVRQLGPMGAKDELWTLYQKETTPEIKRQILGSLFVSGDAAHLIDVANTEQNVELRRRAIDASARATAQAERSLRRVSADLHDGPAQYVALAAMRMGSLVPATEEGRREAAALGEALQTALGEILADLVQPRPMTRLLQGDVGSGKTVVAAAAGLVAVAHSAQVAVMAPTEILAEQHFRTLTALGGVAGLVPALWTGSTPAGERRELARRLLLPAGDRFALDLVVGTHALLEEEVPLPRLGLVVVDEQHRFGVRQRAQLANKGKGFPDVLVMSATPIPRSRAPTPISRAWKS